MSYKYSETIQDTIAKFSISSSQLFNAHYLQEIGEIGDDDKMIDPLGKKMSITSLRNSPFGYGDGGPNSSNEDTDTPSLLWKIPKKIRIQILSMLDDTSLLKLRLVCSRIQYDIDYEIGIFAVINCDKENFNWIRNRSVRNCFVEKLDYGFKWDFLANSPLLQKLTLGEEVTVTLDSFRQIQTQFPNLEYYSFVLGRCNADPFQQKYQKSDLLPDSDIEKRMIQIIEFTPCIQDLKVALNPDTLNLRWTVKMNKHFHPSLSVFGGNLKQIRLYIPLTTKKDRSIWLDLLKRQEKLQTLVCNLGIVIWEQYAKIIAINAETLRRVALFGTVGWDFNSADPDGQPFDWAMFEDCKLLTHLQIVCDPYFNTPDVRSPYMSTINFDKLYKHSLQYFYVEWFSFDEEELAALTSRNWTTQLMVGVIKNCSIDHIKIPDRKFPAFDAIDSNGVPLKGCESALSIQDLDISRLSSHCCIANASSSECPMEDIDITEIPFSFVQGVIVTGWTIIC